MKNGLFIFLLIPIFCFSQSSSDYFLLAIKKQNNGDNEGALLAYNQSIALDSMAPGSYYNRAVIKFFL